MNYEIQFLIALLITIAIETSVLIAIFWFLWGSKKKQVGILNIITAGIITSTLTLPYLWFVLPAFLNIGSSAYIFVGEISIVIIEGLIYKRILPLNYKQAFLISLVANVASVLVGTLIF